MFDFYSSSIDKSGQNINQLLRYEIKRSQPWYTGAGLWAWIGLWTGGGLQTGAGLSTGAANGYPS